jgi:hypothetical protein
MLQTMDNNLHNINIMKQQQSQIFKESGSVHGGPRSISEEHFMINLCAHNKAYA